MAYVHDKAAGLKQIFLGNKQPKTVVRPERAVETDGTPVHLLLQIGDERTRTVALRLSERVLVGRTRPNGTNTQLPDLDLARFGAQEMGVSRVHAAIHYQNPDLYIEDLGSTNGTRVNGLSLAPNTPTRLRNGDELEFGRLRVIVRLVRPPS